MNSKELMMHVLKKGIVDGHVPVTPHWWGLYKFQLAHIADGYEDQDKAWSIGGNGLASIDENFYEHFKPDMLHLTTGPATNIDPAKMKEAERLKPYARSLKSKKAIDEYTSLLFRTKDEIIAGGEFDHVSALAQKYGNDVFIAVNEGLNVATYFDSHMGFENGLIGIIENPENTAYFISKICDITLERVKALKQIGCHGYISSETYCSADILSPKCYHDIIKPVHRRFFNKISEIGMVGIGYFTGNIIPMIDDIKELKLDGLMVEESKKGFVLDIGQITDRLENTCALFGNLDSVWTLQKGTEDDVRRETLRQLEAARGKRFIMANGCPISFGTPCENINVMINTARQWQ